jgi:hypothetical protein
MGPKVWTRSAILAIPLFATQACQFLVPTDTKQCSLDSDCAAHAPYTACAANVCVVPDASTNDAPLSDAGTDAEIADAYTPFPCVNDPPIELDLSRRLSYTRQFEDVSATALMTQISVKVCGSTDIECNSPQWNDAGGTAVKSLQPDAQGMITFDLPYGFNGVLEVTDLVPNSGVVTPALLQVSPPLRESRGGAGQPYVPPALMVSPFRFEVMAGQTFPEIGVDDPEVAHLFFRAYDCDTNPVAEIGVTADKGTAKTRTFYFDDTVPKPNATATDKTGKGGMINVPPGALTLTGTYRTTGKKFGEVVVLLRKRFITYVTLTPTK